MKPKSSNTQWKSSSRDRMQVVAPTLFCPACREECVTTTWNIHEFEYGAGPVSVFLQVRLPVRQCGECGFEYLDEEAERTKHIAICNYLGVLPPDEIRNIREKNNMTRAEFTDLTGLDEASLNCWENGLSIQTHADDRYFRLLAHPKNISWLKEFALARVTQN